MLILVIVAAVLIAIGGITYVILVVTMPEILG